MFNLYVHILYTYNIFFAIGKIKFQANASYNILFFFITGGLI